MFEKFILLFEKLKMTEDDHMTEDDEKTENDENDQKWRKGLKMTIMTEDDYKWLKITKKVWKRRKFQKCSKKVKFITFSA